MKSCVCYYLRGRENGLVGFTYLLVLTYLYKCLDSTNNKKDSDISDNNNKSENAVMLLNLKRKNEKKIHILLLISGSCAK